MDEQNWLEKVGLLKEIGDIKGVQIRMATQLEHLVELKQRNHAEVMSLIKHHDEVLNGNGHPGLKTEVDRLSQVKHAVVALFTVLLPVSIKVFYDWMKGK